MLIAENLGGATSNGLRVLHRLYTQPIISVSEVVALNGTSFPAANQLVARMVELGILSEMTGQRRHRRFAYEPYIQLFDDPAPDGR
ncbi:MAG: MarR family transcriptional regulator [Thermomicrobiales bacterium]|nr:MarR family transcriptional regulator [Thermomicrobiales bacterium]